ncbi:MAG: thiamine-phosphate kinase [Methylococcales bacterium]|nr:thiamine-phosphate kinase [Methylococcales bacterium]
MALSEFGLIQRFFTQPSLKNPINQLGVGDDCALMDIPDGYQLAITTDTMVENVHFFKEVDPYHLGHKLLAVNLSDLASMGAKPVSVTLALTLPHINENWLAKFSKGFLSLADHYNVDLIGGDTTRGALTLTVQALGVVPKNKAMTRSKAQIGDLIYVTGKIGDAGLGLKIKQGYYCENPAHALQQFNQPLPCINDGLAIRDLAHACIDISDGVVADLGHILEKSNVGALIEFDKLPLSNDVKTYIKKTGDWQLPLIAGDDYQLCFTLPPENAAQLNIDCQQIGMITADKKMSIQYQGKIINMNAQGYEHFS